MITSIAPATKKPKAKAAAKNRPALEPNKLYSRRETCLVIGRSEVTVIRAYLNGHLEGYTIGNRVHHMGSQILSWLEAGGRTGCHRKR
jgi:hypothetical protein